MSIHEALEAKSRVNTCEPWRSSLTPSPGNLIELLFMRGIGAVGERLKSYLGETPGDMPKQQAGSRRFEFCRHLFPSPYRLMNCCL
jgi:hypothetical protein